MSKKEALEIFSNWYSDCIDNGIEPEEIVLEFGLQLVELED